MFGLLTALLVATALTAPLPGMQAFSQYRRQQVLLFGTGREHVELQARRLTAHLTRFANVLQARWQMPGGSDVPVQRYRRALTAQGGIVMSSADLTMTPSSIITTLTGPRDVERLALMLQTVRELSTLPFLDAKTATLALSAELISTDGTFGAVFPPLSATRLAGARRVGPRGFIAARAMHANVPPIAEPAAAGSMQAPVWLREAGSARGAGGDRVPILRVVLPITRHGEPFATLMLRIPKNQFQRHFINGCPASHFFVFDGVTGRLIGGKRSADDHDLLRTLVADPARLTQATHDPTDQYRGGIVTVVQRIADPDWIVVSAFNWSDLLANRPEHYGFFVLLHLVSMLAMWALVYYFSRFSHVSPRCALLAAPHRAVGVSEADKAQPVDCAIADQLPVGILVYALPDGEVLIENAAATRLVDAGQPGARRWFFDQIEAERQRAHAVAGYPLVEIDWLLSDGSAIRLGVVMSQTRHAGREVLLVALVDLGGHGRAAPRRAWQAGAEASSGEPCAAPALLAVVSHEVRTPLHGAIGNLELLARSPLATEQRERVATIRRTLDELLGLLDDMLEVSSLEADARPRRSAPVRLDELVEHCAQVFAPVVFDRGVVLYCLTDPALYAPADADARRLTRIVHNLLGNAAKFTRQGEIVLSVRRLDEADDDGGGGSAASGGWVRFEVRDTGIGISAEAQAAVFEPHRQADATIGRRFGGSGLGLFLCRRLAELMGGRMTLASELGKGSVFGLELPLVLFEAPRRPQPLAGLRVGLVCEHAAWRDALARHIESWGAAVDAAYEQSEVPALRVLACAQGECEERSGASGAITPNPLFGTVCTRPDGPLMPQRVGDRVEVTALSNHALLAALTMLIEEGATPPPEQAAQATWAMDAARRGEMSESVSVAVPAATGVVPLDLLVVDDDAVGRALIEHQLAALGCSRVRVARDGQEALDAWHERRPDAVITDIDLPCLDGLELLAVLREHDDTAIVVAMTAFSAAQLDTGARRFSHVLRKPAALEDLRCVLEDVQRAIRVAATQPPAGAVSGAAVTHPRFDRMQLALRDTFVENCRKTHVALAGSIATRDRAGLKRCLHRLQGALSIMGYDEVARDCAALQIRCGHGDWAMLELRCRALGADLDRLVEELTGMGD